MKLERGYLLLSIVSVLASSATAGLPEWSYDAGPDPKTEMGKELIDITANIPNMPEISNQLIGRKQKFRPAFGPIPWRMRLGRNQVKMLFIGQDGTHIAEAAGRPATAGFGGRAQDLAKYFGVNESAAFINTYSFTIKGQYGVYGTPYVYEKDGKRSIKTSNFVDNKLWLMTHHQDSPISKWRNSLVDWIIRNNKDSMKLIVTFGGAARDAMASFAKSKGAEVLGRMESEMKYIQMPKTKEQYAGGNNTFPSLVSRSGGDVYEEIAGEELDYTSRKVQANVIKRLKENLAKHMEKMVFTKSGPYKNGLISSAQIGGYTLDQMYVNGIKTRSLKGLMLDDGTIIKNDIVVIELPHPSYLSRVVMDADSYFEGTQQASKHVMKNVVKLNKFSDNGWKIEADEGLVNQYAAGKKYAYGRSDIGPEFYDFGTPKNRMVSKSTARRMSRAANVVIIGTRDNGKFDKKKIKAMTDAQAGSSLNPENLYIARPRAIEERYIFDAGPSEDYAKLIKKSLNLESIFTAKALLSCLQDGKAHPTVKTYPSLEQANAASCGEGSKKKVKEMTFSENGIAAFSVESHPSVADFGHYRGTFKNPKVVILADPDGFDDIVTARALTGTRGQFLHDAMIDLGINDNYLVIKSVPVAMDGASGGEWQTTIERTKSYREKILNKILNTSTPEFLVADGTYAQEELKRIVGGRDIKIININRSNDYKSDIDSAFKGTVVDTQLSNIPRSHLSFYARVWEGTSGDRVITSEGRKYKGVAFAEVVPSWAYNQKGNSNIEESNSSDVKILLRILDDNGFQLPYERTTDYLESLFLI